MEVVVYVVIWPEMPEPKCLLLLIERARTHTHKHTYFEKNKIIARFFGLKGRIILTLHISYTVWKFYKYVRENMEDIKTHSSFYWCKFQLVCCVSVCV